MLETRQYYTTRTGKIKSRCRECCQNYKRRYNKDFRRDRKYNLPLGTIAATQVRQGNCCAICGSSDWPSRYQHDRAPVVDHDHVTGVVRGLLCNNCNRAIGLLGDSVERLQAAIRYLSSPPGVATPESLDPQDRSDPSHRYLARLIKLSGADSGRGDVNE